jgi:LPXTG-motif cell wall-anchored protein
VRRLLLLVPIVLALVAAPAAFGGGFVTVGLSSTPEGTPPGTPWQVDITVLAHGRTPVEGMPATVRIHNNDAVKDFPTKEIAPGVYRAAVVFPSAGTWSYDVVDGYIRQVHTFPAVEIGGGPAPATAPDTGGGIATGWLIAAGATLLLALAVLGLDRRRRHLAGATPEPA